MRRVVSSGARPTIKSVGRWASLRSTPPYMIESAMLPESWSPES